MTYITIICDTCHFPQTVRLPDVLPLERCSHTGNLQLVIGRWTVPDDWGRAERRLLCPKCWNKRVGEIPATITHSTGEEFE